MIYRGGKAKKEGAGWKSEVRRVDFGENNSSSRHEVFSVFSPIVGTRLRRNQGEQLN